MQISTGEVGDVVVGNGAIDLRCGRNGGVWCCRSLLETMLKRMTHDTAYLYWGRCGRVWRCISLLETVWYMVGYGVVDPYWGRC